MQLNKVNLIIWTKYILVTIITTSLGACGGGSNNKNYSSTNNINNFKQSSQTKNPNFIYTIGENGFIYTYKIADNGHLIERTAIFDGVSPYMIKSAPAGNFIYTIDNGTNVINMFSRDESSGLLSPLNPASIPTGQSPVDMVFDPSGHYAYVLNGVDSSISMYSFNSTNGELSSIGTTQPTHLEAQRIQFGQANADNITRAYVSNDVIPGSLSIYDLNPDNGQLILEPQSQPVSDSPYMVTFDPSGKHAYISSMDGGRNIYMYGVGPLGALQPLNPNIIVGAEYIRDLTFGPFKKTLYSVDLTGGQVMMYGYNESNGLLYHLSPYSVPAGVFSVGMAFDKSGRFAYVANRDDRTISTYIVESDGILTPNRYTPQKIETGQSPQQVILSQNTSEFPIVKYAYVINHDSNSVSMYKKNGNGELTPLNNTPIATGSGPKGIVVDKSGNYVYVVNESSDNVSIYKISKTSPTAGALQSLGTVHSGGNHPTRIKGNPTSSLFYVFNTKSNDITVFKPGIGADAGKLNKVSQISTGLSAPTDITWRFNNNRESAGVYAYVTNKDNHSVAVFRAIGNDDWIYLQSFDTGSNPVEINFGNISPFQYVYVINSGSNSISEYKIDPSNGWGMILIGTIATGGEEPNGMTIGSPNNSTASYAYVTNHMSNTIAMYAIESTGLLTAIGTPIATHKSPNKITFDISPPNIGYVANSGESTVSSYSIEKNGMLTPFRPFSDAVDSAPVAITSYY